MPLCDASRRQTKHSKRISLKSKMDRLRRQNADLAYRNAQLDRKNKEQKDQNGRQFADGFTLALHSAKFQQLILADEPKLIAAVDFAKTNKRTGLYTLIEINCQTLCTVLKACAACKWTSTEIEKRVTHQLFVILVDAVRLQWWKCHPWRFDQALANCVDYGTAAWLNSLLSMEQFILSSPCIGWSRNEWSSGLIHAIRKPTITEDQICFMIRWATPEYLRHQMTFGPASGAIGYYLGNALSFAVSNIRPAVVNELLSHLNPFLDTELVDPFDPRSSAERLILSLPPGDSEPHQAVKKRLDELETLQSSYYASLPAVIRAVLIELSLFMPELIRIVLTYAERLPHTTAKLILTNPIDCPAIPSDVVPPIPTAFPTSFSS